MKTNSPLVALLVSAALAQSGCGKRQESTQIGEGVDKSATSFADVVGDRLKKQFRLHPAQVFP